MVVVFVAAVIIMVVIAAIAVVVLMFIATVLASLGVIYCFFVIYCLTFGCGRVLLTVGH